MFVASTFKQKNTINACWIEKYNKKIWRDEEEEEEEEEETVELV